MLHSLMKTRVLYIHSTEIGKTNCSKEGDKAKCFVETGGKIPPTIKWKVGADVKDGTLDE